MILYVQYNMIRYLIQTGSVIVVKGINIPIGGIRLIRAEYLGRLNKASDIAEVTVIYQIYVFSV